MTRFLLALWTIPAVLLGLLLMLGGVLVGSAMALFSPYTVWFHWIRPSLSGALLLVLLRRPRVSRDPDWDPDKPCVFVANHVSALDGNLSTYVLRRPYCGLENAAHFRVPIYGWLMKMGRGIPVPASRGDRYARILKEGRERIEEGLSILTFPEGHRTLDGTVKTFRTGPFRLARDLGVPVVPIAVRGLQEVLPKGAFFVRPGTIEVHVGAPIEAAGTEEEGLEELAEKTRQSIADFVSAG